MAYLMRFKMNKIFLFVIFVSSILCSLPSKAMSPCQILGSLGTFAGMNFTIVPANKKLDQKKADFKNKETETYKALETLKAIASIKTPDLQDQLIAQLPEKDKKAFEQRGTSIDRRRLMCHSRIHYYQAKNIAYKSAQDLMVKEKDTNGKVGFFISLLFAGVHGYYTLTS